MTEPTMAALDKAVFNARECVYDAIKSGPSGHIGQLSGSICALIAAAEARGAARERVRECVWVEQLSDGYPYKASCGAWQQITPRGQHLRCDVCGGRVRVEEVGDAMP